MSRPKPYMPPSACQYMTETYPAETQAGISLNARRRDAGHPPPGLRQVTPKPGSEHITPPSRGRA